MGQRLFGEWQACEISTDRFETATLPNQGISQVSGPGLGDVTTPVEPPEDSPDEGDECMFQRTGFPRSRYTYEGDNPRVERLFERWQNCVISTERFETELIGLAPFDDISGPGL